MKNALLLPALGWLANVRLAHWQADTLSNQHRALGDLYDAADAKLDEIAEVNMGKLRDTQFPSAPVELSPIITTTALLEDGLALCAAFAADCTPQDGDLLNLVQDLQNIIHRARYLLKA